MEILKLFKKGPVVLFKMKNSKGLPIEYISENIETIMGYPSEYFLKGNVSIFDLVYELDYQRVKNEIRNAIKNDSDFIVQEAFRVKHSDGHLVWISGFIEIVRNEDKSITHYQGYIYNVTKSRENEEKLSKIVQDFEWKNWELEVLKSELEKSEKRWKFALEGSGDGIWDWNMVNNDVFFSTQWKKMLGFRDDEISDSFEEWERRVHPDDLEKVNADLKKHIDGEVEYYQNEHRVLCKDWTYKWILDRGKIVEWTENGKPARMIGTHTDLSIRIEMESELRENKEMLDLFFAQSLDGFFFMMLDEPMIWNDEIDKNVMIEYAFTHQKITKINAAMLKQYKAKEEDFIGLTPSKFFEHDIEYGKTVWKKFFDEGRLHIETDERDFEGNPIWIEGDYILLKDKNEKIIGHFGVQRDVTERKRNEDEIKKLALVAEKIDNAIIIADENDKIEWVNDGFTRMTGYTLEEIQGKRPKNILRGPESVQGQIELIRNGISKKEPVSAELINYRKNGEKYWVEISIQPIYDAANQLKFIAIEKDITERKLAEQKLTDSRNQYHSLVNNIPGIVYRCKNDEYWTMIYMSSNIDSITGFTADELLYNKVISYGELILPEDSEMVTNEVIKGIETKSSWEIEYRIKHRNGTIRWAFEKGRGVFNGANELQFLDGFILDITERKIAQEKLKEREIFLKMIQETVQVGIVLINRNTLEIKYVNPKAEELIGLESKFIVGRKCQDIFCVNEGNCPVCQEKRNLVNDEKVLRHEDGRLIKILKSTSFVTLGDEELLLESFIDISDRVIAEEKLKETERRYNGIVNNSSDAVFLVAIEGPRQFRYIGNNATHQRLTGITYETIKDKTPEELLGDELSNPIIEKYTKCLNLGFPYTYEESLDLPAGQLTWITSLIPITNDNSEVYMLVGISRDITERKKYEVELKTNEGKLRESEEYYRTLIRSIPDMLFVMSKEGEFLDYKSDSKDLFTQPEFFIGKRFSDIFPSYLNELINPAIAQSFSTNDIVEINYSLPINSVENHFEARMLPLGTEKLIVFVRNTTAQIESEKALISSEMKFRTLFESLPTGVTIADKDGNILNSNSAAEKILGLSHEQQKQRTIDHTEWSIIRPDGSLMPNEEYPSVRALKENQPIYGLEMGVTRSKDDIAWIIVNATPVPELGVVISYQDITELKKAQSAIFESEEKFRSLSESAKDGIIIINSLGNVNYWNKGATNIFGYEDFEILGKNMHSILTPSELFDLHNSAFKDFVKTGKGRAIGATVELPANHKDGRRIDVELSLSAVFIKNEWQSIGIVRDISERKIIELELKNAKDMAESANAAKSEFLANMSHEIRTPMNSILGFSEILLNTVEEEKHKKYLDTILKSGKTLLALINDILDLSKIEAGKMVLNYELVSLTSLVQEIAQIFSQKAQQKDIEIKINVDSTLPNGLNVDEVRLRQILLNLVGNAIKFTSTGYVGINIIVNQINTISQTIDINIVVEDSGIGIKTDQLEIIFDAFQQQEGQSTRKYGGTGLGLAICKKLVEMMNGKIYAESEFGAGSKFIVNLKNISFSEQFIQTGNIFEWDNHNISFNGETILIVDDIAYNRELVIGFLKDLNLSFIEAENGLQAIEYVETYNPSLVVMDIRMPIMNGFEATRKIKLSRSSLPIIAFTASTSVITDDERNMFDDYLRKPVQKNELLNSLSKFLEFTVNDQQDFVVPQTLELKDILRQIKTEKSLLFSKFGLIIEKYFKDLYDYMDLSMADNLIKELENMISEEELSILNEFVKDLKISFESFDFDNLEELLKQFENEYKKLL